REREMRYMRIPDSFQNPSLLADWLYVHLEATLCMSAPQNCGRCSWATFRNPRTLAAFTLTSGNEGHPRGGARPPQTPPARPASIPHRCHRPPECGRERWKSGRVVAGSESGAVSDPATNRGWGRTAGLAKAAEPAPPQISEALN